MTPPGFLRSESDGVLMSIKLQPRSSANEIVSWERQRLAGSAPFVAESSKAGETPALPGNELRIKVTAPPVDSAANEALIRLLADKFNCPRNRIELLKGHRSRHKLIKLYGFSTQEVLDKLSSST